MRSPQVLQNPCDDHGPGAGVLGDSAPRLPADPPGDGPRPRRGGGRLGQGGRSLVAGGHVMAVRVPDWSIVSRYCDRDVCSIEQLPETSRSWPFILTTFTKLKVSKSSLRIYFYSTNQHIVNLYLH